MSDPHEQHFKEALPLVQRVLFSRIVPWLVLLAALASSWGAWRVATINEHALAAERFESRVQRVKLALVDRADAYQQLMHSGAALFASSDHVSASEWRRFHSTLRVEQNYPGLLGFGYARHVVPAEYADFIDRNRRTLGSHFAIWPKGKRERYVVIAYLQPDTPLNHSVIGYDMFSEEAGRRAMERAAQTGQAVISGKTWLKQDQIRGDSQPGFLMYQPVYRSGSDVKSINAVEGYIYGAFRMGDFIDGIFGPNDDVSVTVYDGTPSRASLMYDNRLAAVRPVFRAAVPIEIAGRTWIVEVSSRPAFEHAAEDRTSRIIGAAGVAISLLLFALTLTLSRLRDRSLELARTMTARIKENEQRLAEITSSLGEGVYVKGVDGKITFINPEAERMLGWSEAEVIGRHAHDVYHHHTMDGSKYPDNDCPIVRASRNGEVYRGEDYFWHKNGSIVPVLVTSTPIFRDGRLAGAVNVFRDISERKRDEARVRESEQFRALFEYAREALFLVDGAGFVLDANRIASESLLRERSEIVGCPARDFMLSPMWTDGGTTIAAVMTSASPDAPATFEGEHIRKDGSRFPVEALFSPIRIGEREVMLVAARDISERRRAERERRDLLLREREAREAAEAAQRSLARSNADLEHFAYAASHDLQEPLRMVAAYNQLLRKRFHAQLGPDGNQFLDYSIAGAQRMEQLLQGLLSYLRVAAAEAPLELVDANDVLSTAMENLQASISEAQARIESAPLPRVRVHAVHLLQLFQNIIGNAIKYRGDDPPHVVVSAEREAQGWQFSIADNGIGIEPRYAQQVFGIFKRLHGDKYGGTGIGLAICQKIVERYGGRIWVEPRSGQGSVFHFTLPAE